MLFEPNSPFGLWFLVHVGQFDFWYKWFSKSIPRNFDAQIFIWSLEFEYFLSLWNRNSSEKALVLLREIL